MGASVIIRTPIPTLNEFSERLGLSKARQRSLQPFFIERRSTGTYAVKRMESQRARAVFSTQAEAVKYAKSLKPSASIFVERTHNSPEAGSKKWRRA